MAIALCGLSDSRRDAPFDDPKWEVWGLPWDQEYWCRYDRLFEMHDLELIRNVPCRKEDYEDKLKQVTVPLYMQEDYPDFPCTQYPFDKVPTSYFNSSIAYMMALAIKEENTKKHPKIAIYGVDMLDGEEYAYQRPNMEYLIGLAKGMGLKVIIHDLSPLCKFNGDNIKFGNEKQHYRGRYGRL